MANTIGIASKAKVFWFFSSEKNCFLLVLRKHQPMMFAHLVWAGGHRNDLRQYYCPSILFGAV